MWWHWGKKQIEKQLVFRHRGRIVVPSVFGFPWEGLSIAVASTDTQQAYTSQE
jgi:hypothetical protein